ncbi:hypothetical protein VTK73DRAFT_5682 [Phialemonium thermophilum]|uniref:Uncharacterized protein n=1 Tax=Phialemonium thermophilum TaxID=223376 RepID=A0ABR3V0T9_9PEZI
MHKVPTPGFPLFQATLPRSRLLPRHRCDWERPRIFANHVRRPPPVPLPSSRPFVPPFFPPSSRPISTTPRTMAAQEYKIKGITSLDLQPGDKQEVELEGLDAKVLLLNAGGKVQAVGPR